MVNNSRKFCFRLLFAQIHQLVPTNASEPTWPRSVEQPSAQCGLRAITSRYPKERKLQKYSLGVSLQRIMVAVFFLKYFVFIKTVRWICPDILDLELYSRTQLCPFQFCELFQCKQTDNNMFIHKIWEVFIIHQFQHKSNKSFC